MLLGLLFLSTLLFTWQISTMAKTIKDMRETLALKEGQQAENQQLANSIESLQGQLNRYQASMALYDSLVPGSDRWSRVLTRLSHGVEDLNSVWLTDFNAGKEGTFALTGFTVYRKRIPRMAALFDNSVLKEVNVLAIREEEVYKYTIDIPAPPAGQ